MIHETISRPDNRSLYVVKSIAQKEKAKLLVVHGYGEHSGRYTHFFEHCKAQGISIYSFDLIGHGKSAGLSAYVPSKEVLMEDLDAVRGHFNLGEETFLMGHSLGGLIVTTYCLQPGKQNWKGLITSGAALEIDKDMSPILQKIAPIVGAILPKLKTTPLDITFLTRSDEVLKKYNEDPMVYKDGMRARTAALTLKLIKIAREQFGKISLPLLALHGSDDRITMPGGTQKLHAEAVSTDKTVEIYQGLYHELIHEPERETVMNNISTWITERA